MPTTQNDTIRLLREVRGGSTAAPLELFIRIRDELSALTRGNPLVRPGIPPRMHMHTAYLNMVASEARTSPHCATFLSIASTAVRHLLTHDARAQLGEQHARLPAPSFETVEQMMHEGASLAPRHLKTLVALDKALDQLETHQTRRAQIVECRFFGRMSDREIATALSIPVDTVPHEAALGMQWLLRNGTPPHPMVGRLRPPMTRP